MKKPYRTTKTSEETLDLEDGAPAVDGLTVLEDAVEEDNEPRPSVPVEEAVVTAAAPAAGGMAYLGTFAMPGMTGRGGHPQAAGLPVLVRVPQGPVIGVLVVSDPGLLGSALTDKLAASGYGTSLQLVPVASMDRDTRLAAARTLAAQKDSALDRSGALLALGYTATQLA